jgi:predicted metal-binding membrane protein
MLSDTFLHHTPARRLYLGSAVLIAAAWGLLMLWQGSAYAELLGHESLGHHSIPFVWHLAGFLLSWSLMTVAMMLPGSLPMLIHIARPAWQREYRLRRIGSAIAAYLSPWVLFGLLAFLGDSALHEMTEPGGPLAAFTGWIAPAVLLTAGVYQLTPLKSRCLDLCRPLQAQPDQAEMNHEAGAWLQGLRLGIFCVGSCWPLMLLMFALGHHQLGWMLVLSAVMAAERLSPWGLHLARMVGLVLIVSAALRVLA